jgi:hypothetical protein
LLHVIELTDEGEQIELIKTKATEFNDEWQKMFFPLNQDYYKLNNTYYSLVKDEIQQNFILLNNKQLKKYKPYVYSYLKDSTDHFQSCLIGKENFYSLEELEGKNKWIKPNEIKEIEDAIIFYSSSFYLFLAFWQEVEIMVLGLIKKDNEKEDNEEKDNGGVNDTEIHEFIDSVSKTKTDKKLKWLGTPSQFGFIIDLLIQGGYLERPTSSFQKDANFYLQHFDINTTPGTLAIEVSENTNHLSTDNRKRIIIPHKDKLK